MDQKQETKRKNKNRNLRWVKEKGYKNINKITKARYIKRSILTTTNKTICTHTYMHM